MPLLAQTVTELPSHVFDPVIRQSVEKILNIMSFRDRIGDNVYINTDFTAHSRTSDKNKNAIISSEGFRVDAEIQMNPFSQKWEGYNFHHSTSFGIDRRSLDRNTPIYLDAQNRVRIVEYQCPASISMNCTLTLSSRELAYQTPHQLFNQYSNGSVIVLNDMFFDYPVPKPILAVLHQMWLMDRSKGDPAGIDFYRYIVRHTETSQGAKDGWQLGVNRHQVNNTDYEVLVPVYKTNVYSTLEYQADRPEAVQVNKASLAYRISFGMSLQFEIPSTLIMEYPVIYNNQIVSEDMVPIDITTSVNNIKSRTHQIPVQEYTELHTPPPSTYVQSPRYDDWVTPPSSKLTNYRILPMWIIAATVDETEEGYVTETKLNFMEDFDTVHHLKQPTKEIMVKQGSGTIDFDSIFNIQLYRNDTLLIPHVDFQWDPETMDIIFTPRDTQSHYHVVISQCGDLSYLNPKYFDLAKEYFKYLPKHLKEQIIKDPAWKDPNWWQTKVPGYVKDPYIDSDGNIRNEHGDIIGNITTSPAGGNLYGNDENSKYKYSRVTTNRIIATRSSGE